MVKQEPLFWREKLRKNKNRSSRFQMLKKRPMSLSVNLAKFSRTATQPAFTCSKLTIETLEQGVKYVQS